MVARALLFVIVAPPTLLFGQADYRVYIDHPRLFLDADVPAFGGYYRRTEPAGTDLPDAGRQQSRQPAK